MWFLSKKNQVIDKKWRQSIQIYVILLLLIRRCIQVIVVDFFKHKDKIMTSIGRNRDWSINLHKVNMGKKKESIHFWHLHKKLAKMMQCVCVCVLASCVKIKLKHSYLETLTPTHTLIKHKHNYMRKKKRDKLLNYFLRSICFLNEWWWHTADLFHKTSQLNWIKMMTQIKRKQKWVHWGKIEGQIWARDQRDKGCVWNVNKTVNLTENARASGTKEFGRHDFSFLFWSPLLPPGVCVNESRIWVVVDIGLIHTERWVKWLNKFTGLYWKLSNWENYLDEKWISIISNKILKNEWTHTENQWLVSWSWQPPEVICVCEVCGCVWEIKMGANRKI